MDGEEWTNGRIKRFLRPLMETAQEATQTVIVRTGCLAVGVAGLLALNNDLASVGLFGGYTPSFQTGVLTLGFAAGGTLLLIAAAGLGALLVTAIVVGILFGRRTLSRLVFLASGLIISVPLLAFVPLWFSIFGDGDVPAALFLFGCLTAYLLYAAAGASMAYAKELQLLLKVYDPPSGTRRRLTLEFVGYVSRGQLREIAVLSVPFSVAAELISGTGGLGHIATLAYRNGNFGQLAVAACAYLILFAILDAVLSLAKGGSPG